MSLEDPSSEKDAASYDRFSDRFPFVGFYDLQEEQRRQSYKPRDRDWLPANWELILGLCPSWPKGRNDSDNREAILQWLDVQVEFWQASYDHAALPPEQGGYEDPEEIDAGVAVRNAYRLVDWLREKCGWAGAPPEPQRRYIYSRKDVEALVEELKKVRTWVAEADKLDVSTSEVVYRGKGLYERNSEPVRLEGEELAVLEALVKLRAATTTQLVDTSGYAKAVKILKRIKTKYRLLADAILLPGGPHKGGYRTTIQDARAR